MDILTTKTLFFLIEFFPPNLTDITKSCPQKINSSDHLDRRHCVLHFLLKRPEARRVSAEQNTYVRIA